MLAIDWQSMPAWEIVSEFAPVLVNYKVYISIRYTSSYICICVAFLVEKVFFFYCRLKVCIKVTIWLYYTLAMDAAALFFEINGILIHFSKNHKIIQIPRIGFGQLNVKMILCLRNSIVKTPNYPTMDRYKC